MEKSRSQAVRHATLLGLGTNLLLTGLKLTAGIVARSQAMVADGLHSLSDMASDLVLLLGFRMADRPEDDSHHYGHGKFETLVTLIIGLMLLAVAGGILWQGVQSCLLLLQGGTLPQPGWLAAGAALLSILSKELLYRYTINKSRTLKSKALEANAWHQRSDALSSVAAMAGISGAILLGKQWRILDPVMGILVGVLILKVGFSLCRNSLAELMEASLSPQTVERIHTIVDQIPGVQGHHRLRTRSIGNQVSIDLHIQVDPGLNVSEGHDIATAVEQALRREYGSDTILSTHIEPSNKEEPH